MDIILSFFAYAGNRAIFAEDVIRTFHLLKQRIVISPSSLVRKYGICLFNNLWTTSGEGWW